MFVVKRSTLPVFTDPAKEVATLGAMHRIAEAVA